MKKIVASVGLIALGATSVQALDSGMVSDNGRFWSVSATLRGFYDDNINTIPSNQPLPPGYSRGSTGWEVSPAVFLNFPLDQTSIGAHGEAGQPPLEADFVGDHALERRHMERAAPGDTGTVHIEADRAIVRRRGAQPAVEPQPLGGEHREVARGGFAIHGVPEFAQRVGQHGDADVRATAARDVLRRRGEEAESQGIRTTSIPTCRRGPQRRAPPVPPVARIAGAAAGIPQTLSQRSLTVAAPMRFQSRAR